MTGSFEFIDADMDFIIDAGEVSTFSVTSSGFTDTLLNGSISDGAGDSAFIDPTGAVGIGGGVSAGNVTFASSSLDFALDWVVSLYGDPLPEARIFDLTFTSFEFPITSTIELTVTRTDEPPIDVVPVPASLPLLAGGLVFAGLYARRRKS